MERAINNDLQHHLIFSVNKINVITRYRTLAQQGSLIHKNMTPHKIIRSVHTYYPK